MDGRVARRVAIAIAIAGAGGCEPPEGLLPASRREVTVAFDPSEMGSFPWPNDVLTRFDGDSPTGLRLRWPVDDRTRRRAEVTRRLGELDGWGLYGPVEIPFTDEIDIEDLLRRHPAGDDDVSDDGVYLVDVDPRSDDFGRVYPLDFDAASHPEVLRPGSELGPGDLHGDDLTLLFSERDEDRNRNGRADVGEDLDRDGLLSDGEDRNGNGRLDPPEDRDVNGILDRPNTRSGASTHGMSAADRADVVLTGYAREDHTLIARPRVPLAEKTRYAVVVTDRVRDRDGDPVGSPFDSVNHTAQTDVLRPLLDVLPHGVEPDDVAFAFAFTTGSVFESWSVLRDGLRGEGIASALRTEVADDVALTPMRAEGRGTPLRLPTEDWIEVLPTLIASRLSLPAQSEVHRAIVASHRHVDAHVAGTYASPQLFDVRDHGDTWGSRWFDGPRFVEQVPFWVALPRSEVPSVMPQRDRPMVILLGDLDDTRLDMVLAEAGIWTGLGAVVVVLDLPGAGSGLGSSDQVLLRAVVGDALSPGVSAWAAERRVLDPEVPRPPADADGDGRTDPGAGTWSYDPFHTRDAIRQAVLDVMRWIALVDTFDGETRWPNDVDGDGRADDVAGDLDGDGRPDLGPSSPIVVIGRGWGATVASVLSTVEPGVDAIVAFGGGARLADLQFRSEDPVANASIRAMVGPSFELSIAPSGVAVARVEFLEGNHIAEVPFAVLVPPVAENAEGEPGRDPQVRVGDTVVVEAPFTGRAACGYVLETPFDDRAIGRARVDLPTDRFETLEVRLYRGPALDLERDGTEPCVVRGDAHRYATLQAYEVGFEASGEEVTYLGGRPLGPLLALHEGMGMSRASAELRRYRGLSQMVLDAVDPGVLLSGPTPSAPGLWVAVAGDLRHPVASTVALAKAAGDLSAEDEWRLRDAHALEGVAEIGRHVYPDDGQLALERDLLGIGGSGGVVADVMGWGVGHDPWGDAVPRVAAPDEAASSRLLVPYVLPSGAPKVPYPGESTDRALQLCRLRAGPLSPECGRGSWVGLAYDPGWAIVHVVAAFLAGSRAGFPHRCWSREACGLFGPLPAPRPAPSE